MWWTAQEQHLAAHQPLRRLWKLLACQPQLQSWPLQQREALCSCRPLQLCSCLSLCQRWAMRCSWRRAQPVVALQLLHRTFHLPQGSP